MLKLRFETHVQKKSLEIFWLKIYKKKKKILFTLHEVERKKNSVFVSKVHLQKKLVSNNKKLFLCEKTGEEEEEEKVSRVDIIKN